MNLSKPIRKRDPKYLAWIRRQPCTLSFDERIMCTQTIEANHIRAEGHGGLGTKPDDSRALPFCSLMHLHYHQLGRRQFEETYEIELETEIKRLNALYLREHPQVRQKAKRETVAVHLKHCLTCARSVKRCKARKRI